MEDWTRWDHYVEWTDGRSNVTARVRCSGRRTAEAIAETKRQLGFDRVRVFAQRFTRHKEQPSHVHYRGLYR